MKQNLKKHKKKYHCLPHRYCWPGITAAFQPIEGVSS